MHRSRLAGFIDCQTEDVDAAAHFWSNALGMHPSRVHLDIETDDIEAEATRLKQLGARRIGKVKTWIVMAAPTGQRFCVVRPQSEDFPAAARSWD